MLNLNTRIYFDEVEFTVIHIHQEFDSTRTFIIHMLTNFAAKFADFFALFFGQIRGRCAFNHFLVAALYRTIAFPKVVNLSVAIPKNLHLNVAGLHDHPFQIALTVAKRRFGFATTFQNFFFQFFFIHDGAHSATTTTP